MRSVAFLFVFLSCYLGFSKVSIDQITTLDGLSQNDVNFVFQDSKGFMWFGTVDGLNRYDGENFVKYHRTSDMDSPIGSNIMFAIAEDSLSNLWIGTSDSGVWLYNRKNNTFIQLPQYDNGKRIVADLNIKDLYIDSSQNLWIASKSGLSVISLKDYYSGHLESFIIGDLAPAGNISWSPKVHSINSIQEYKKGILVAGTISGVVAVKYVHGEGIMAQFLNSFPSYQCFDIQKLNGGYLFSFYNGLFYKDDQQLLNDNILPKKVTSDYQRCLYGGETEEVWTGNNNGLYHFQFDTVQLSLQLLEHYQVDKSERGLNNNKVQCITRSRDKNLWVGTLGGGVHKLNMQNSKFKHFIPGYEDHGSKYSKVNAVYEDKSGNLWLGVFGKGLYVLPANEEYTSGYLSTSISLTSYQQNAAYCFTSIPGVEDKLLVGSGYPLLLSTVSLGSQAIEVNQLKTAITHPVFAMLTDGDGYIWIGTYGGGVFKTRYNTINHTLEIVSHYKTVEGLKGALSSNIIRSIIEDDNGHIFIGTDNGLNVLSALERNKINPKFKIYQYDAQDQSSLSYNYLLDIYKDIRGRIWIGTMGGGLCMVDDKNPDSLSFVSYTSKDGLPNDVIKSIEEDAKGMLWLSSNQGLTQFNPGTGEVRNYSMSDGLQDKEFSELASCKRANGSLIFGGVKGFNVFDPTEIIDSDYSPNCEFTEFYLLNKKIEAGKEYNGKIILDSDISMVSDLTLTHKENSISLAFSVMEYTAPEKIKYKYLLEGFDSNWNETTNQNAIAKYTNLPPGDFVFRVKFTNRDGVWSSNEKVLNIKIIPPLWQTPLAFVIYFILLGVCLAFFRKYSVIAVRKKNKLEMENFEKEKMEELVQLKLQFFTNISHEFRTPLTLIQTPLEKLISQSGDLEEEDRQENYSLMRKNVAILNRLINQLMEFRKVEAGMMPLKVTRGDITHKVNEVFDAFKVIAKPKQVDFKVTSSSSMIEMWVDYDKIEKVLYNLLSNAFKHVPLGGKVQLSLTEIVKDKYEWLRIDVTDNGPGIDESRLPYIFGMFYKSKSHKLSKVSGTGIGLAYVESLIKLHHGEVTVESNPHVETKFSVFLRKGKGHFSKKDFAESEIENSQLILADTDMLENQLHDGEDQRIEIDSELPTLLVVEDNMDLQFLIKANLESEFNVIQAYDGIRGVELAKKYLPSMVISDVMMPEMDGFEMIKTIKTDESTCHIPIIMLTAKATDVDRLHGLNSGAEAYLVKPFTMEILMAQINSILDSRSAVKQKFSKTLDISPSEVTFTSYDEKLLEKLLKVVEKNIGNADFTVVELANEVGMNQANLNKKLKALLGQTANVFIRTIRLKRAAQLLSLDRLTVSEVVFEVGFNDVKYFRECFKKQFGTTPSDYASQNKNENSL